MQTGKALTPKRADADACCSAGTVSCARSRIQSQRFMDVIMATLSRHTFAAMILGIGALLGSAPPQADAATLNVPADHTTIQAAIDASTSGDTILVAPGRYLEHLFISDKDLTIAGTGGPAVTVIETAGFDAVTFFNAGGDFSGFTITTTPGAFGRGAYLATGLHSIHLHNCIFDGSTGEFGGIAAGIECFGTTGTIDRNIFRNTSQAGDRQFLSGVIVVLTSDITITNNVFEHNEFYAVNLFYAQGHDVVVANNTMVANGGGIYFDDGPVDPQVAIRNNIIVGNTIGLGADPAFHATVSAFENNLLSGNTRATYHVTAPIGSAGNISTPPKFRNQDAGDYHLQATSPAVDSGSDLAAPLNDFDGNARPIDGDGDGEALFDIGAFEAPAGPAYDVTIQDDSTGDLLRFNSKSGQYAYVQCGASTVTLQGGGTVRIISGCQVQLRARGAVAINAVAYLCRQQGTASVTSPSNGIYDRLTDSNTSDNTNTCP
jgi:hypothetical protein